MGRVVQAAALPFLRPLDHVDGDVMCVDVQHLDQTAMAGIYTKPLAESMSWIRILLGICTELMHRNKITDLKDLSVQPRWD